SRKAGEGIQASRRAGDLRIGNLGGVTHVRGHQFRGSNETRGGMSRIKTGVVGAVGEVYVDLQETGRVVVNSGRCFHSLVEEMSSQIHIHLRSQLRQTSKEVKAFLCWIVVAVDVVGRPCAQVGCHALEMRVWQE